MKFNRNEAAGRLIYAALAAVEFVPIALTPPGASEPAIVFVCPRCNRTQADGHVSSCGTRQAMERWENR